MSSTYRSSLVLLVLLNVVFIHITGAVELVWLLPLYILTATAVFTRPLRDNKIYRLIWNLGVLATFTVLVIDASTSGIAHLLEDGLILAVFCQVHLLNVLQKDQKPDLLFFNSFLIALVTSFFSQDLIYSLAFLVYALVFLVSIQLSNLSDQQHEIRTQVANAVLRDGIKRAVIVMGLTAMVFMFCPRDFDREGLVRDQMLWNRGPQQTADFSEEVRLGRSAQTTLSNRVAMEIHILQGAPHEIPQHWRGATLSMQNSQRWYVDSAQDYHELDERWRPTSGKWQRQGEMRSRVRVEYQKTEVRRLFNPLGSIELKVHPQNHPELAVPQSDGTVRYSGFNFPSKERPLLSYEVSIKEPNQQKVITRHPFQLEQYRRQDPKMESAAATELLSKALTGLDPKASEGELVERCRWYLSTSLDYLLPGERGSAENLSEFMSGEAGGHCEYFASALAVILRMRRIPCRMVTGYLAEEWNEDFSALIVRDKHAHAWLEVHDSETGWYTVDPSPPAALEGDNGDQSNLAAILAALEEWWKGVTQFDADSQGAFTVWLVNLPGNILAEFRLRPLRACGWVLLVLTIIYLRRRLRGGPPPELREYLRALRRAGLERRVEETPRELLARALTEEVRPEEMELLASATAAHETLRYRK